MYYKNQYLKFVILKYLLTKITSVISLIVCYSPVRSV